MKQVIVPLLILILINPAFASNQPQDTLFSNQVNGDPNFLWVKDSLVSTGNVLVGISNESEFKLFSSEIINGFAQVALSGDPTIQAMNSTHQQTTGNLTMATVQSLRKIGSFYQKEKFVDEFNDRERIRINESMGFTIIDDNLPINNISRIPPNFGTMDSLPDYSKVISQTPPITAFLNTTGLLKSFPLNDSDGNEIGEIFGFVLSITILFYRNSDQEFIGFYQTVDRGYGNLLPKSLIDYLKIQNFANQINESTVGSDLINSYNISNLEWIDYGYNDTIKLNVLLATYSYQRSSFLTFISDQTTPINQLRLNVISDEFENYAGDFISASSITSFSEDELNLFEEEITQEYLSPDIVIERTTILETKTEFSTVTNAVTTGTSTNETSDGDDKIPNIPKNIIFMTQFIVLVLLTVVFLKKKGK
ncbi:MAG: hypothetical protein ACW99A_06485 [Candidatus Kariarchaeaceae archaeon]|jgi:hypothetical protein